MMVDLCLSFRKVVKSQERLGKAVQEVSEFELCIVLCNTRNSLGGTEGFSVWVNVQYCPNPLHPFLCYELE